MSAPLPEPRLPSRSRLKEPLRGTDILQVMDTFVVRVWGLMADGGKRRRACGAWSNTSLLGGANVFEALMSSSPFSVPPSP